MRAPAAAIILAILLGLAAFASADLLREPERPDPVDHAVRTVRDTGSVNAVTAVLLDYRALDTLGEATVILMTATVVAFLAPKARASMLAVRMSKIVLYGVMVFLPFIAVFGLAIMLFGHVSPGGGFTGGVVLATTAVIYAVVYSVGGVQSYVLEPATNKAIENIAMFAFLAVGFIGLMYTGSFLGNFSLADGMAVPGTLLSAGVIPALNVISGLKVGVGLGMIVISMFLE